jgi:uncharacterized damage-inducible protein DinB
MTDLRYPIGPFVTPAALTPSERAAAIDRIAAAPAALRRAVAGLGPAQLDTPYRDGGWAVRQVVHHVPDSHLNAYIRFKLGLTEEQPTIKPYDQQRWAQLPDTATVPVDVSLTLLEALHVRWVALLRGMSAADFARTVVHPEMGTLSLDQTLALYAWHGEHHTAHVTALRARRGW